MRTQEDNEFLTMMQQTPAQPRAQQTVSPGKEANREAKHQARPSPSQSPKEAPKALSTHADLHALDPRPDLTKDHRLWVAVLMVANRIVGRELDALESMGEDPHVWKSIAGNLHGLRCYGAQLKRRGNGTFKLDYKPVAEQIAWERDCTVAEAEQYVLETYLEPHKVQIKAIFDRTVEVARLARKGRRVG